MSHVKIQTSIIPSVLFVIVVFFFLYAKNPHFVSLSLSMQGKNSAIEILIYFIIFLRNKILFHANCLLGRHLHKLSKPIVEAYFLRKKEKKNNSFSAC